MKVFSSIHKDFDTGLFKKVYFVRFYNGHAWTQDSYERNKRRQIFRRMVINRFYHLAKSED